ncbi:MAG: hypothetical protein LBN99_08835 [Oscillospiraceae bacterium]|nr:hypothetical protein [Oscillospiraceae bacterium]
MDIAALLGSKALKPSEKREQIADALRAGAVTVRELGSGGLDEKQAGIVLEAMEAVSRNNPEAADTEWLNYAQAYIAAESNSLKREASRVVGNIAAGFPDDLDGSIEKLLENTKNDGTVVRWGSAYALGRVVLIPKFANSDLFDVLTGLAEREPENGVKNQYLTGLKKARKLRK